MKDFISDIDIFIRPTGYYEIFLIHFPICPEFSSGKAYRTFQIFSMKLGCHLT